MHISIGFVSRRERSGAERKLLKGQVNDPNYSATGCWMHLKDRKLAAEVAARLVEKRRTFDVVVNEG
jgi:hypothetical protein